MGWNVSVVGGTWEMDGSWEKGVEVQLETGVI